MQNIFCSPLKNLLPPPAGCLPTGRPAHRHGGSQPFPAGRHGLGQSDGNGGKWDGKSPALP